MPAPVMAAQVIAVQMLALPSPAPLPPPIKPGFLKSELAERLLQTPQSLRSFRHSFPQRRPPLWFQQPALRLVKIWFLQIPLAAKPAP
jgi:hypothetical protein